MAPAGVVAHSSPPAGVARWISDPEVDAGCCSHLEFCALWALVPGIHLLLRSLAFTCLSSRSTLRSLWTVLRLRAHRFHGRHQRLPLLPGLRLSGLCTRARARPHVQKKAPGPSATEERWLTRGDWRSSWFAERQVCSAHSVPLLIMFPPLLFSVL